MNDRYKKHCNELLNFRNAVHQDPELSFEEHHTHDRIAAILDAHGITYRTVYNTGIVAYIMCGKPDRGYIGLRADMDALPIQEDTGYSFSSQNASIAHSCGHDAHMTALLSAALILQEQRDTLENNVCLIFQPGEEEGTVGGAKRMIDAGAFSAICPNIMFGLHVFPKTQGKKFGLCQGRAMACCDIWHIKIQGFGGHISTPHNAINPIYVANKVISSLESIKGQQVDPFDSVIMDIGSIHAGTTAGNIIPESVMIYGNTRAYSNETRMRLKNSLIQMTENVCKAFSCQCSVHYMMGYDPVINDDMASKILFSAAENVLGGDQVYKSVPSMGAEDFSSYAALCPCAFGFVETESSYPLHNPHFIADVETIFAASDIFIQAVKSVPGLSPISTPDMKANEDDIKSLLR